MTAAQSQIFLHKAPGELRAILCGADGKATHTFSERYYEASKHARFGSVHDARLRTFADDLSGAFCELASGEEAFLRLKTRDGLTEGVRLAVMVVSEARDEKLTRVSRTTQKPSDLSAFELWTTQVSGTEHYEIIEDRDRVAAAFDDALSSQITLPGGGRLFIERTRALVAIDIDSAGRAQKGNASARALRLNIDAAQEAARQLSLRRLGGNVVLDCVGPLNTDAATKLRDSARKALERVALGAAKVLKPSPLGLLEMSLPWKYQPLSEDYFKHPVETEILKLLREVQQAAESNPTGFYEIALCSGHWRYYQSHKAVIDEDLFTFFSGRIRVGESQKTESEIVVR